MNPTHTPIADDLGVQGLAQLGRNAIERVSELERENAELRARLATIDAAPAVAIADSEYRAGVVALGGVWNLPVGTELIARPTKDTP